MNLFFKCGPVVCQLRDFLQTSIWNMWQWKLDPYVIQEVSNSGASVLIESDQRISVEESELERLLSDEPSGFFKRQVWQLKSGDMLWRFVRNRNNHVMLSFLVDADWSRIRLLEDDTQNDGQACFEYLNRMVIYSMIRQSVLTFHGVLMEYQGKGIIISAPSGTGKTTHARLWRDHKGVLIINGDNACCYRENEQWTGFGIPWCGTSGESVNRSVPIKALVILDRGEQNQVRQLSLYEAFKECLPMLHTPTWDADVLDQALTLLDEFLDEIPVIGLKCRPDAESVDVLCQYLETIR